MDIIKRIVLIEKSEFTIMSNDGRRFWARQCNKKDLERAHDEYEEEYKEYKDRQIYRLSNNPSDYYVILERNVFLANIISVDICERIK